LFDTSVREGNAREPKAIGIIGGADGPTSITVTTSVSGSLIPVVVLIVVIVGVFVWYKICKKKNS
jgi:Na+-transporting methylmalonyl-CoA/oxaloacetate decarboxylase beta subunit